MFNTHPESKRRALCVALFASLCVTAPTLVSAQTIAVDGDLTDLVLVAGSDATDPGFDVSPEMRSGFDFTRVLSHYHPKTDTLYLGLDVLDSILGPGVAGDADGDSDPNVCSLPHMGTDQFGVGPDEFYVLELDTNDNGNFDEYFDLRLKYRDNRLTLERGDRSRDQMQGLTSRIAIGTRGAPTDPRLPNQNRATEDIEIAIHGYATLDETPRTFGVRVRAGTTAISMPDDVSDDPIRFEFGESLEFRTSFPDVGQRMMGECAVAFPGDIVTVSATVTNLGDFALRPTWMIFHIPVGFQYVNGSVRNASEGRMIDAAGGNVMRFIRLGGDATLSPGESETVTFDVEMLWFPFCHMTIRGYAEGVLPDAPNCVFSCLDTLCIIE